jgi:hypothetical protein
MRRLVLTVLLLAGVEGALWAEEFSAPLPEGFPDVSTWELVAGGADNARVTASYKFYVNPLRQGLYQVMRYRVSFPHPADEGQRRYSVAEKAVWNEMPGHGVPLRCFELLTEPLPRLPHWQELAPRSMEYDREMAVVIQLLFLHRGVLARNAQ